MRMLKPKISLLVLTILFMIELWNFCAASHAPVAQKLSITTLDYVQTLHWEPAARHTNLTESQTLPVQQRYTVYMASDTNPLEFKCQSDDHSNYGTKWHRLPNCDNTTALSCIVQLSLEFNNDYLFWVARADQPANADFRASSNVLHYKPRALDDMTFSAPRFTAKRLNPSNVIILFHPVTKPWWDCGNLTNFFSEMGIELEYMIEYYGCPGDPNNPTCRHNAQKISILATEMSIDLTTKIPENTTICVEVKIFFNEYEEVYSNSTKVCLAPLPVWIPNKPLMLVGLVIFAAILIVLTVWLCRRCGKQLFRKLIGDKKVPVPVVSRGVWKDDSSVAVRLTNGSHQEEKEVAVPLNLGLFNLTKEQPAVDEMMEDIKQQQNYVLVSCESASYDESDSQESNTEQLFNTSGFQYESINDLMVNRRCQAAQLNDCPNDAGVDFADRAPIVVHNSYRSKTDFMQRSELF